LYLEFLKKYKIYVAIILALLAGILLCLVFLFLFKKDETYIPVKPTDENLVYFDVNSQNPPSLQTETQKEIDDSALNVDEYNKEMKETLSLKEEAVRIPIEEKHQKSYIKKPKYLTKKQQYTSTTKKYQHKKEYKKIVKLKKISVQKIKHCIIKPSFFKIPLPPIPIKEIQTIKLEYANAFELADFLNKNIHSDRPIATAKGNSEIILIGNPQDILNAEKVTALLDTRPKVAVFKLDYTKPYKMANMIANAIFNGDCIVAQEGAENSKKTNSYAIYYNNSQNSITIVGASKKQMDLAQEFIQFTDIKSPQAFLDIMVVEFNEQGSCQFQKLSQFNINNDCSEYGISSQNIYSSISNIICNGGGKILAKPRLTISNDSDYNVTVTSDYVKCKQSKEVYHIEQDCGTKLKIHSCINPKGEVFLTLEPQYVTVKKSIPNERNAKATLFNRKSFKLENIKMKDRQTLYFGGVNSQQEYRKMGRIKLVNTELVMFVNVRILD
jgi:type II secretory pathway component GspD/PulD (secretin)